MSQLDPNALQSGRSAQEFQSVTMMATADVIAAIIAKVAEQDVKIDDLIIMSGRTKAWDGPNKDFPRDDTFNLEAGRLKDALTDPESKASFRVYLQYPDGQKVEIFRQTAGKIVKDDYNLANDLRAAYAMDAVEQFTPERGAEDFIISFNEAQEMAKAQGFELPAQPSDGREAQNELQLETDNSSSDVQPDPWGEEFVQPLAVTELNDRTTLETQIEVEPVDQTSPSMIETSSPEVIDMSTLTYSQQRNLAALDDVNGQIAELDRRAGLGMTYIADPEQNPGYKALMDRAENLRESLGDLTVLADSPTIETNAVIDVHATSVADVLPVPEIKTISNELLEEIDRELNDSNDFEYLADPDEFDLQAEQVEVSVVDETQPPQTMQDFEVSRSPEEKLQNFREGLVDIEHSLSELNDQYDEIAAEIGPDRVDSQIYSLEWEAQSFRDQINVSTPEASAEPSEPGAIAVAGVSPITEPPIYEQAFIEDIFDDYPLEVEVQKLLVGVADVRGQLETLRNEMNVQLQSTAQLSDAIVQNVESPPIERWADKIGGVAETQATGWKEQLRNAVAVTVEFAQQIYESPVGQYVAEQTVAGVDAVGQYIGDRAERDIQTTKAFVADRLAGTMPDSERLDAGIALLIEHKGSSEEDRGIAHHEGYTFLKSGNEHGVIRDSDGSPVYKSGKFTGQTTSEDKAYLQKFSSVAAAAGPLIQASGQGASRDSGGASA